MKALSLIQPYASAIVHLRLKKIETRSWKTDFRGRIAIHASKGFPLWARAFAEQERLAGRIPGSFFQYMFFQEIIGFATIAGMRRTEELAPKISEIERIYGDYTPGRWGWLLEDVIPLARPISCNGALGLWDVPAEIERKINDQFLVMRITPAVGKTEAMAASMTAALESAQYVFPFAAPSLKADR